MPARPRGRPRPAPKELAEVVGLPDEVVEIAVVAGGALLLVLLILVVVLAFRLRSLRRAYKSAVDPDRQEDVFAVLRRHRDDIARLREDLEIVHGNTEHLRHLVRRTVSRIGVVRYDAFEDMGGALSFSAALLDEAGDGVVISAINGRTETRSYAKPVVRGRSEHNLTPEEEQAIAAAIRGDGAEVAATGRRRRRSAS
jgi:hypothetical protein